MAYYAVIDDDYLIWGVGTTESAAIKDARRSEFTGNPIVKKCSAFTYRRVRTYGGCYCDQDFLKKNDRVTLSK